MPAFNNPNNKPEQSDFERAIRDVLAVPSAIRVESSSVYNLSRAGFVWRTEFKESPLAPPPPYAPTRDWVLDRICRDVAAAQVTQIHARLGRTRYRRGRKETVSESIVLRYLHNAEQRLFSSPFYERLGLSSTGSVPEMVDRLVYALGNSTFGNPINRRFARSILEMLESKVRYGLDNHAPLFFVVPAFPFKSRNRLLTMGYTDHVDFGEVSLLVRLHLLALSLNQIYPYGVQWIVVSDGVMYHDIFGLEASAPAAYLDSLRQFRNRLGIRGTVHLVDLFELVSVAGQDEAEAIKSARVDILTHLMALSAEPEVSRRVLARSRQLAWYFHARQLTGGRDDLAVAWNVLHGDLSQLTHNQQERLQHMLHLTAQKYFTRQLAIEFLDFIARVLPDAVRATTRPKPGQIAIPSMREVHPWNGVAVLTGNAMGHNDVRSIPLHKLFGLNRAIPVYMIGQSRAPFYIDCSGESLVAHE